MRATGRRPTPASIRTSASGLSWRRPLYILLDQDKDEYAAPVPAQALAFLGF
jgi:hypothetical protein